MRRRIAHENFPTGHAFEFHHAALEPSGFGVRAARGQVAGMIRLGKRVWVGVGIGVARIEIAGVEAGQLVVSAGIKVVVAVVMGEREAAGGQEKRSKNGEQLHAGGEGFW